MKKTLYTIIGMALLAAVFFAGHADAQQVIPSPAAISIPYGQTSTFTITYRYEGTGPADAPPTCLIQSITGEIRSETITIPLTNTVSFVTRRNPVTGTYSGIGTETITLTAGDIERARKLGETAFIVDRMFQRCDGLDLSVNVLVRITGAASADFSINRIELYFENRRPEITVERNTPKLKAFADLRFNGSGLFEGYWEVDGRILSREFRHVTYGRSITLETPPVPSLPTFTEGSHVVRFVITKPETAIPLPLIVYYVTPEDARMKHLPIVLKAPIQGGFISAPVSFSWDPVGSSFYLISFYEESDGNPLFSAFVREPHYTVPDGVLPLTFHAEKKYYWKVTGFGGTEPAAMGESEMRNFFFKK